jgi:hypothetical protein
LRHFWLYEILCLHKDYLCVLESFFLLQVSLRRSLFATLSTKFGMTHVRQDTIPNFV